MNDANIKNDCNTRSLTPVVYETLTKPQRNKLAKVILGRNNLKATYLACDCSELTIKRAIAGMNLFPETAAKIRAFLETK
ncbi:hypothetical protein ACFOTA_06820 [Chitinophaga sp. GCM10012297]|uniref:Uncharacterized protein n=1 Tax=Chitinophaga chungangae TaxID=2821488 RepID=A0ABS3YB61_9BACT|nr:hypothetical protein [Chitinophaga chungangae]MBO9151911.1 hypothetical protein [Chitinophaga chungangae]